MKFIHTADWQIRKQFANIKGDIAAFLREARFDVIKTIGILANQHKADAILFAGDVFDANEVSDTTIAEKHLIQCKNSKAYGYCSQKIIIRSYSHPRN